MIAAVRANPASVRRDSRCSAGAALALAALPWALGACASIVAPRPPIVRELAVESAAWSGPPIRIGVVSDVHAGPHMSPDRVRLIALQMNALDPDLVLLGGDYVGGHGAPAERSARQNAMLAEGLVALGEIEAPLGVYAVLGNHDWWYDGPLVTAALEREGVVVLENAAREIGAGEDAFWIAGLADYSSLQAWPDWAAALTSIPESADVIALAHWPDVFLEAPDRVALTVAGHTHCGQINLPILGRPAVSPGAELWPCGLYEDEGRLLYVTGGVGVSVLPVRFRAPPEIAVVTLSSRHAQWTHWSSPALGRQGEPSWPR